MAEEDKMSGSERYGRRLEEYDDHANNDLFYAKQGKNRNGVHERGLKYEDWMQSIRSSMVSQQEP